MAKYKAAAYMRLSVAGSHSVESDSIENQEYIIESFVKNNPDIEIVSRHIDDGYSGLFFSRPSFTAMMQEIIDGTINCIIVKDLSRFGREFVQTGKYLRQILPAYGVRFISVAEGIDTSQTFPHDNLLMQIKTAINDEFSREISVKTRNALQAMRKSGLYVGACPVYGYVKSADQKNHLVIDEAAAMVVRDIFEMKISGYSAVKIADMLNRRNVPSPLEHKKQHGLPFPRNGFAYKENAKWSATTVIRILKDETYTGTLVQGKQYALNYKINKQIHRPTYEWTRNENAHDAIISKYDFQTVQRIMLLDTRTPPGKDKVDLFSGLLVCGCCNSNMTRKINYYRETAYQYFYCPRSSQNGCNSTGAISEEKLVAHVFDEIRAYIIRLDALIQQAKCLGEDEIGHALTKNLRLQLLDEQEALQRNLFFRSGLEAALTKGLVTLNDHAHMKNAYSGKITHLEKKIDGISREIQDLIARRQEFLKWLEHICECGASGIYNRALVVIIVKDIRVKDSEDIEVGFVFDVE